MKANLKALYKDYKNAWYFVGSIFNFLVKTSLKSTLVPMKKNHVISNVERKKNQVNQAIYFSSRCYTVNDTNIATSTFIISNEIFNRKV